MSQPDAPPPLTRDQARSRRRHHVRARTINIRQLGKRELVVAPASPPDDHERPLLRGECVDGPRPCPFVSCRYHLYLDVSPTNGSIQLNFPDLEVEELVDSCALDVAEGGEAKLEEVGAMLNVTRERIRQIENRALATFRRRSQDFGIEGGPDGKRRLPLAK